MTVLDRSFYHLRAALVQKLTLISLVMLGMANSLLAVALPSGRPNYVVTMFGGDTITRRWSIIRTLALNPAGVVADVSWV